MKTIAKSLTSTFLAVAALAWAASCVLADEQQWDQYTQDGMRAYKKGNDPEAERLFRLAAQEAAKFPAADLRYAKTLGNIASACLNQGKNAEAEVALQQSLAAKEKALGKSNPSVATTLNDLGVLAYGQYKYKEAEDYFKRVLDMDEQHLPPNHQERASTLENYSKLLHHYGNRNKEADAMELRASAIRAQAKTPEPAPAP